MQEVVTIQEPGKESAGVDRQTFLQTKNHYLSLNSKATGGAANINDEEINLNLKKHQENVEDWEHRTLAENLHQWAERFVPEFKLQCPVPALRLDRLRVSCHGHFRIGRNGFGLLNEIAINQKHITQDVIDFDTLGTLLHELIHSEQQTLGTDGKAGKSRNYHNVAFIRRARYFGLIVDRKGYQEYAPPPTRFSQLLAEYGIEVPESTDGKPIRIGPKAPISGNSKLKLWVCSCKPEPVRVRVAIADFQARCLKCGELFVKKS